MRPKTLQARAAKPHCERRLNLISHRENDDRRDQLAASGSLLK
jgi:hypothetical protein